MSIKIVRNDLGNCINFYGSSNPTYWNACLSGEVDINDNTLVNVKNDIKSEQAGASQYEFYRIPYTEFLDDTGTGFANASEVANYITTKGNVTVGLGVNYRGIWNPDTNTPDITTDSSTYNAGDFFNVTVPGTHDLGNGDGDIDFNRLVSILDKYCPKASFIPEIWQGHKNGGEGFWIALERLEKIM